MIFDKAIRLHFSRKSCCLSSGGPEIAGFHSHYSANFPPTLSWFISNVKLKYEDSDDIKTDRENTLIFNLHDKNRGTFYWDTRYSCHYFQGGQQNSISTTIFVHASLLYDCIKHPEDTIKAQN